MNNRDITRYEINEHGELPLSYGRYVRWEEYLEVVDKLQDEIARLEDSMHSYHNGYDEGFADAKDLYKQDY